jgi:hypothetical protein
MVEGLKLVETVLAKRNTERVVAVRENPSLLLVLRI